MAAETPSSRLLESSRSLAFLIQDATDLPPVSRSIHQIAEQSERMLSGAPTAVQPGAATYRFLASQGVDAMDLDPSVLDLYRGSGAPAASLGSVPLGTVEELEAFIAGEQRQMLHEAVLEANQLALDEFDASFAAREREQWDSLKPRILQAYRFEAGRYEVGAPISTGAGTGGASAGGGALAAPPLMGVAPAPHALGRSAVRSARSLEFAAKLSALWQARASGGGAEAVGVGGGVGAPLGLLEGWVEVACSARVASLEGASTKLSNCWKLLARLSKSSKALLDAAVDQSAAGQRQIRLALLDGAIAHLGEQQHDVIRRTLDEQREAAMRGGVPGTEYDAAAKLNLEGGGADGEQVSLDGGKSTPLWPTVYWCLRCGDISAAVRVMRRAASQLAGGAGSWPALLSLVVAHEERLAAGSSGTVDGGQLGQLIADARAEYWAHGAPPSRWLAVVYSVLAAPEPHAKLEDLMPTLELTIEEWLWHRLAMVRVQLLEGTSAAPASAQPLVALQALLYERLGEAHFNKGRGSPLLFTTVLLHSLQFERALAFLYTYPEYADEAAHLALALHHAGLIATSTQPSPAADGLMLDQTSPSQPLLCLPNMLEHLVSGWAREDGLTALQYLFLLRGPPTLTEALAVDILVRAGVTDALLSRVAFLAHSTQRRLMEAAAQRLHAERGMSTHAARLLFECRAFEPLASLLIDLLSAALLASPTANPTLTPQHAFGMPAVAAADPAAEARAAQLRTDAQAFMSEWRTTDAAAAASMGAPLSSLLLVADVLYTAGEWRRQRASATGEAALTATLTKLDALPLLPRAPVDVDMTQADFRLAPSTLQRLAPPLLLTAMEAVHAKFNALRRAAPSGGVGGMLGAALGASTELRALRERAEALVAFGSISVWRTADAMGHAQMPQAASQQLASWLSDMA